MSNHPWKRDDTPKPPTPGQRRMRRLTHPMQPIYLDDQGTVRFKPNEIIQYLFERGNLDLNLLATMRFSARDRTQIAMLLGYSVSGAGDLDYFERRIIERADRAAANRKKAQP